MNDKKFEKWEKRRKMGALRFILFVGLLWSVLFLVSYYVLQLVVPFVSSIKPQDSLFTLDGFLLFALLVLPFGPFVSGAVWFAAESAYKRRMEFENNKILRQ